ncbi:Ger(x)C family spore germination protein [Laceyella sacchari]|uniref:Spore germination protein n=1 Tax=Laceyella tengchongensis TaxID=574699 RepID=A0AA46AD15_9BACL|nr:Ger(x)C family spore germination protein [Laceyella tengchongensis]AUS08046.1 Ger(x)C family spore germination protein [Laceyella sacchari]SMP02092.1 spore germination protein [Laceyella tengchongensis]
MKQWIKWMKPITLVVISICIIIFGNVTKNVLDEIQLVTAVGYDYIDEQTSTVTEVTPIFRSDASIENKTLSITANLGKEALIALNRQSSANLANAKLEVALFNKEMAKRGILHMIDILHRDPNIGTSLSLAVTDGATKKILNQSFGTRDTGHYIASLLEHNTQNGSIPNNSLHYFLSAYYTKGKDPFLPLLKLTDGEITLTGLALFKKDRMVFQLDRSHLFTFNTLYGKNRFPGMKVQIGDKFVAMRVITSNRRISIRNTQTTPEITIYLNIRASISEFSGKHLKPQHVSQTEHALKKQVSQQGHQLIRKFQQLGIDPLGLGDHVRSHTRNWDFKTWQKQYPRVKVRIVPRVNIVEIGVVDGLD